MGMARRFPNPIPLGTRVPQWALLDVTVRCYVFFSMATYLQHSSLGIIGIPISRKPLAVGILFFFLTVNFSHPCPIDLDSPEILPGKLLGTSSSVTSHAAGATTGGSVGSHTTSVSAHSGDSSTGLPAPTSKGGSSSNTGAIVGGVVGGVAAISIAVAAIFFFLRQQRPQAPSMAATPGIGASQPAMDEVRPLTDDSTYAGSMMPETPVTAVPMRLYVRVFMPNRLYVSLKNVF
jgi:hypothetical protein